jgi:hypothetical protein
MSLAEGKAMKPMKATIEINETDLADAQAAVLRWQDFPASFIQHHGEACCHIAREWMVSMDFSQLTAGNMLTGPRWLRRKFQWGPTRWPLHWCEAVEQKKLDCGALAALALELFNARGVKAYPAQFIQQYAEQAARHWHRSWTEDEADSHWIMDELIYHEGCAVVVRDREIKLWDPTASWWVNPKQFGGYGAVLLARIFDTHSSESFKWGTHTIRPNRWEKIERARGEFA